MGDLDEAIDLYHQALGCKPDDPFASEMLSKALQEALNSIHLGEDENNLPDQRPLFLDSNLSTLSASKSRLIGQDQTFASNNVNNQSPSMMSLETSDVDMSVL